MPDKPFDAGQAEYDRYSVVTFAPSDVRDSVEALRRRLPPSGRPIMAAHVTLKGTFVEPDDLDAIATLIRDTCATATPFQLTASRLSTFSDADTGGLALMIEPSEPLMALHRRLVNALGDHCRTIYDMELEDRFHPHLTICQQVPAAALHAGRDLVAQASPTYTFPATEAVLVGRRGAQGWEQLVTVPLGRQVSTGDALSEAPATPR